MIGWLFAAVGLANRYLQIAAAFLIWSTELLYPFYMIHQTVTVITVYWLLTGGTCPSLPAFLLTVLSTFGVTCPDLRRGRAARGRGCDRCSV